MKMSKEEFVQRMLERQKTKKEERIREYVGYAHQNRARQTRKYKWPRNNIKC